MTTTGRHRRDPSALWTVIMASTLLGIALGASGAIVAESAASPSTPQAIAEQAIADEVTQHRLPVSPQAPGSIRLVSFAEPATIPTGLSLTVLPPQKIRGGVLLTISLVNPTTAPIIVDTGELGPHDPRFDGAAVPMTMTPVTTDLVPGEGYTYQCVVNLPATGVGQLALTLGQVTVIGTAAGN